MLEFWLNEAIDWADRRKVPATVKRDEVGDWFISLEFKDSEGQFFGKCVFSDRDNVRIDGKRRRETDEEYSERIGRAMDRACVHARTQRNQKFTKTGAFKNAA